MGNKWSREHHTLPSLRCVVPDSDFICMVATGSG
jgi:hypothetical protein